MHVWPSFFRHVEAEEKPSKKSKKGGAKGSGASLKESTQPGLCISRFCLFYITKENGDQNTWSNSPSALGTKKNGERKGPSQGIIPKM